MRTSLQFFVFIALLFGFSDLIYAEIEITVYGGKSFRKGLCLEIDNTNSSGYGNSYGGGGYGNQYGGGNSSGYNQNGHCNSNYSGGYNSGYQDPFNGGGGMGPQNLGDKMPWIMGGDIIYRVPTVKGLGIGVRYQYMLASENRNVAFLNLNPKINAHRIGFLLNYRHVLGRNDGAFIGAILSLDIFRHATVKIEAGLSTPFFSDQQQLQQQGGVNLQIGDDSRNYPDGGLNIGTEFTASNWIGTGQVALEAGFKSASGFLMKVEAGYSLYSFHDIEASIYAGGGAVTRSPSELQFGTNININSGDSYRSGLNSRVPIPNMRANLSAFYVILGIGFTFEAS